MKQRIQESLQEASNLDDVKKIMIDIFKTLKKEGNTQIGFVSGIITSEGPENVQKNIERLRRFTDHIRSQNDFPIFSSTDIFNDDLYKRIHKDLPDREAWEQFYRDILGTEEKFITHIFMTPKWKLSHGAVDEHETASKLGINIHYLEAEI